jgi:hypothetical protein
VIVKSQPGFYESDYLNGRIYVLNENQKIPVSSDVILKRLESIKVIWCGDKSTKRGIKPQNDMKVCTKMILLMKAYHKSNFGSYLAICGWITLIMNRAKLPLSTKCPPIHVIGPGGSGTSLIFEINLRITAFFLNIIWYSILLKLTLKPEEKFTKL